MKNFSVMAACALAVTGVCAGEINFTPVISSIPDIVLGDNTPAMGVPLGGTPTVESLASEEPDSFLFEDALIIYNLVEDQPSNFVGYTPDDELLYRFYATPYAGGQEDAYSIEGTTITGAGSTVIPDADGTLTFEDIQALASDPPLGLLDYAFANNMGTFEVVDASVINCAVMTLEITNKQGHSASDEFYIFTVKDGPDSLFGDTGPLNFYNYFYYWTHYGVTDPGALGSGFPGDPFATGDLLSDDDRDGSEYDLLLSVGNQTGPPYNQESYQTWQSPIGLIPYMDGQSMRLSFTLREHTPATNQLVETRMRWAYGTYGRMGGGNTVARPAINKPHSDGTVYSVVLDQLPVAPANNPALGDASVNENDITLYFEALDLFADYQGAVELESISVTTIDTAAIIAEQMLLEEVDDFDADVRVSEVNFSDRSGVTVILPDQLVLTTPLVNESDNSLVVYGDLAINLINVEGIFSPATLPAPSGLIYRTEFDVSMSNSVDTPLPKMVLRTRTTEGGIPRDTTATIINSIRENGELNPAYTTGGTYAAYHHFPDDYIADGISGSGFAYGDGISTSIALQDEGSQEGGSITVTGIRVYTVPESIFPPASPPYPNFREIP